MLDLMTRAVETSALGKVLLAKVGLTDKDMPALRDLLLENPQITDLHLSDNKLTKRAAYLLCQIKSLKRISMDYTEIDSDGAVYLISKPNLEFLDISGNKIDYHVCDLADARRSQGVEIVAHFTPLDPDYVDTLLQDRAVIFRMPPPKPFWKFW